MARDYVGRKPTPKKRNTQKTPPKKRFPWVAVVILIVVIIGFSVILWKVKNSASKPAPLPAAVQPKATKPVMLKPLPKRPKEPAYIRELENKQVKVKVPKRKKPKHQYQMQCASFRNRDDAETLKAKIAFTGLSSLVKRTEGKNGTWFRVILGPYKTRRDAERDLHQLQRSNINGCQVWYWN